VFAGARRRGCSLAQAEPRLAHAIAALRAPGVEAPRHAALLASPATDDRAGRSMGSGVPSAARAVRPAAPAARSRPSFDGISILTANLEHAMDEAFRRRVHFCVRFEAPDDQMRARLWQKLLPVDGSHHGDPARSRILSS
jgi:hypothetical protein